MILIFYKKHSSAIECNQSNFIESVAQMIIAWRLSVEIEELPLNRFLQKVFFLFDHLFIADQDSWLLLLLVSQSLLTVIYWLTLSFFVHHLRKPRNAIRTRTWPPTCFFNRRRWLVLFRGKIYQVSMIFLKNRTDDGSSIHSLLYRRSDRACQSGCRGSFVIFLCSKERRWIECDYSLLLVFVRDATEWGRADLCEYILILRVQRRDHPLIVVY